jgi:hypothetical protein
LWFLKPCEFLNARNPSLLGLPDQPRRAFAIVYCVNKANNGNDGKDFYRATLSKSLKTHSSSSFA